VRFRRNMAQISEPGQPPADHRRLDRAAGAHIAPLAIGPSAGEWQLIGSAMIFAKHLYRLVWWRFAAAIELRQPLFARCHRVNLHCQGARFGFRGQSRFHVNKQESHRLNAVSVWKRWRGRPASSNLP
jgi:hypothetical protein